MDRIAACIVRIAEEAARAEPEPPAAPGSLPAVLSRALDAWIADQPEPKPSRRQAVHQALSEYLTAIGYLAPTDSLPGAPGRVTDRQSDFGFPVRLVET